MEKVDAPTTNFSEVQLQDGGMVEFDSRSGAYLMVFGRYPLSHYVGGERPPTEIGPGVLPVKLIDTTNRDTSRQQFGIERRGNGPFMLINYSGQSLSLNGLTDGKRSLAPGMETIISRDALGMQRVKIGWRGGYEVSVVSMGASSNDETWKIGFKWKKQS